MMNKKLMALAVGAALTVPGLALAQASNVQVYGLLDVRVDQMKFTQSTSGVAELTNHHVTTNTVPNRIGFRGTEDLGAGMSAFFQIESQVFTDAKQDNGAAGVPNALVGGRPSFVGLRGASWGEVSLGLQDTVYGDVWKSTWNVGPVAGHNGIIMGNKNSSGGLASPNCTNLVSGNTNKITTPTGAVSTICTNNAASATSFDRRLSNTVIYRSPVIAGAKFAALLTANGMKEPSSSTPAGTAQSNPMIASYSLTWAAGPFALAGGYERHTGLLAGGSTATIRDAKDTGLTLGGRFNYGKGLLGLGWERLKYGATGNTAATDNGFTLTNWAAQGTFNVTPADIIALEYSKTDGAKSCGTGLSSTAATPTCGTGTGAKMTTLSYNHDFSKRTMIYAMYTKIDNNAGASYYFIAGPTNNNNGGTGGGLLAGVDVTLLALGVRHSF